MSDTQSSIPTYYDARVTVKPCDPDRMPYLPGQVLYLIACALPNPESVFNFALASKQTWENLQPALWKCEVTYESRLGQIYGGISSDSLHQHFSKHLEESDTNDDSEEATTTDPENPVQIPPAGDKGCQHGRIPEQCVICGDRIKLENRTFESPFPDSLLFTERRLTALHWACKQGPSALPLARNLIRSAQVHQPSYIDGVGLRERTFHHTNKQDWGLTPENMPPPLLGDLPPPLFFAVAHGNMDACRALIDAGCSVNLLQGQSECQTFSTELDDWETFMTFKVHKECVISRGGTADDMTWPLACVCQWFDMYTFYEAPGCQTAGHIAIQHDKIEMLKALLRGGLDVEKGFVALINYSVVQGNVAAIKTLLEHNPSLLRRRAWYRPLIKAVPWIEKRPGENTGAHYERVRRMLEYLVAHGANVDSESDADIDDADRDEIFDDEMTALQMVLEEARSSDESEPRIAGLLTAAEVFIRGGASWDRPLLARTGHDLESDRMLDNAVVMTAGIFSDVFPLEDETETAHALESRKAWGRLVKAMIETGRQSQADANNTAANRTNLVETFSNAFTYLVNFHDPVNGPNRFGPWGIEAVGKLLLSTGISPSPAEMEKWKILCRSREEWISEDGDRSQWQFLLDGVDADQLKIE